MRGSRQSQGWKADLSGKDVVYSVIRSSTGTSKACSLAKGASL